MARAQEMYEELHLEVEGSILCLDNEELQEGPQTKDEAKAVKEL